jgi:hypothetical protein
VGAARIGVVHKRTGCVKGVFAVDTLLGLHLARGETTWTHLSLFLPSVGTILVEQMAILARGGVKGEKNGLGADGAHRMFGYFYFKGRWYIVVVVFVQSSEFFHAPRWRLVVNLWCVR